MIIEKEAIDEFITADLAKRLFRTINEFHGSADDLIEIVGMIVVGRLYGWKVMRLVSSHKRWKMALQWVGDPKLMMEPEGVLAGRSRGLEIVRTLGGFWDYVTGKKTKDVLPLRERKLLDEPKLLT